MDQMNCLSPPIPVMLGSLACLLGYSLLLILIIKRKLFKEPQYLFLANLSANNIAMALCHIARVSTLPANLITLSDIMDFSINFFARGFLVWTMVLSINRYLAITKCLRYPLIMKRSRIAAVIIISFVISGLLCALSYAEDHFDSKLLCYLLLQRHMHKLSLLLLIICTVVVSISTSCAVHTSAKRQRKAIMTQIRSLYGEKSERMDTIKRQQMKTRGILIMTCIFNAFFIPTICVWCKIYIGDSSDRVLVVSAHIFIAAYILISPFMYIATLKPLNQALWRLFRSSMLWCNMDLAQPFGGDNRVAVVNLN